MLLCVRLPTLCIGAVLTLLTAFVPSHDIGLAQQSAAPAAMHRLVLGYYVPYDATSWESLQAHSDQLDIVAPQWVNVDACGNLSSRDDQTLKSFAHARGLRVVPSLFTISSWLDHAVLTDDDVRANAIQQIAQYTLQEDYDGFDLDLEGIDPGDRDALTAFVADVADVLHRGGKLLTLAIPAKERDVTVGWAGAYDYAALGRIADLVTVMAYEYRGPFSGPGSVAPFDWVQRVSQFATAQIPSERVLLGLAFYGYDWNSSSGFARSIGYPQFAALAERYQADVAFDADQRSLTFNYENRAGELPPEVAAPPRPVHTLTLRPAPACDVAPPQPTPTPAPPSEPVGTLQTHQVWLEDATSAAARLTLVQQFRAAGVATWRLGQEDPAVWSTLADWRSVAQAG